jgi:ATP-dependent protease ClpP protease subunit
MIGSAVVCRKIYDNIAHLLSKHTGHSSEKIKRDINRPRYFSPSDAVDYGLIDRVLEAEDKDVSEALEAISKGKYEWELAE